MKAMAILSGQELPLPTTQHTSHDETGIFTCAHPHNSKVLETSTHLALKIHVEKSFDVW